MRFTGERLSDLHELDRFSCGDETLDEWLIQHARLSDRSGTGRTYVWLDNSGEVVAYYTLAPHVVRREDVPGRIGRGSPDTIPSVLLARLALAERLQGQGIGGALLADAIGVALDGIRVTGGRLIVVDAIDDAAAAFYEHHGFTPTPADDRRLVMKASDAARTLGVEWP